DVLESLEKKGFIIMKLGKPIKYIAVSPEEVIERVKKRIREESQKHTNILEGLSKSEMLSELQMLYKQGVEMVEPTELSGAIKGRGNLNNHLETMAKSAELTIDIMTTEEGLIRKSETLKQILQKAKEKGVAIRIAAPLSSRTEKAVEELSYVADVRNVENIKARFVLIDGKQLIFMFLDDARVHPTYDAGIWVNTPFFASALRQMFESEWSKMEVLKQ
ncbi:MAG: TrmB family transcriptional regulator, partial [Candidatus Nanoarchaeia archaeon]